MSELKSKLRETEEIIDRVGDLIEEYRERVAEEEIAKGEEVLALLSEAEEVEEDLAKLENTSIASVTRRVEELRNELNSVIEKLNTTNMTLDEVLWARMTLRKIKAEVERLARLGNEAAALKEELEELIDELTSIEEKYQDLRDDIADLTGRAAIKAERLSSRINELINQTEELLHEAENLVDELAISKARSIINIIKSRLSMLEELVQELEEIIREYRLMKG